MLYPEHELRLSRWPPRLDGLRVAVVSDLHAGGPRMTLGDVDALVAAVTARAPDVVALVGDYVDPLVLGGTRVRPDEVARRLARLRPTAGTLAVLGNHDWFHDGHAVGMALRQVGIRTLDDRAVRLTARGGPLWVAGVGDLIRRRPLVGQALAEVPHDEPALLLTHHPDVFPLVPRRVALTLAGHLHGGQVNVPLPPSLARHPSRYGWRYRAGHVVEGGRHLFVSRGAGDRLLPVRVRAPAEVPVLTLRAFG